MIVFISGKKAKRARKKSGYQENTPVCKNCTYFKAKNYQLRNSIPLWQPDGCRLHRFSVSEGALCDNWICKETGVALDNE